jgi:hypothetical protein
MGINEIQMPAKPTPMAQTDRTAMSTLRPAMNQIQGPSQNKNASSLSDS